MSFRIIILIDMDCFYVQVEQRLRPELYETPVAVTQVTGTDNPGLLIAVSYEARSFGVKRGMAVNDARRLCPSLTICSVPVMENIRKADLARYRAASEEVFHVFDRFPNVVVEKASVDEAYLDVTFAVDNILEKARKDVHGASKYDCLIQQLLESVETVMFSTYLADGNDLGEDGKTVPDDHDRSNRLKQWIDEVCRHNLQHLRLAVAAKLAEEIRAQIKALTQFHCSAGIGNNKMLAKLICSRHKPKQQSVLPQQYIAKIFDTTPISSIRNLGGKLGSALCSTFGVKTMGELALVPPEDLHSFFPDYAARLLKIIEGDDDEPVKPRIEPKSIAVSKNFPGRSALTDINTIQRWINGLAIELSKRLYEDQRKFQRTARNIVTGFVMTDGSVPTKTFALIDYRPITINAIVWGYIKARNGDAVSWTAPPITHIQMSASRFENRLDFRAKQITSWFKKSNSSSCADNIDDVSCSNIDTGVTNKGNINNDDDDDIIVMDVVESTKLLSEANKDTAKNNDTGANESPKEESDDEIVILNDDSIGLRFEPIFTGRSVLTNNNNKNIREISEEPKRLMNTKAVAERTARSTKPKPQANNNNNNSNKTKSGKIEKKSSSRNTRNKISEFFK